MMKWLITLMTLLSGTFVFAQPNPDTLWTRTYHGGGSAYVYSMQQTSDGGYVLAGTTASHCYLVKTDNLGDTLWTRTYGSSEDDCAWSVQQTNDGGYILAGRTRHFDPPNFYNWDCYVVKTNSMGDIQWTRVYGGGEDDWVKSIRQTADDGYILTGKADQNLLYLVKTNSSGDTMWIRVYRGLNHAEGEEVIPTIDGGYIIAGGTNSGGSDYWRCFLVKTDSIGDTLWTRVYDGVGYFNSVQQTVDGGYIVAGMTQSFGAGYRDFYLVKTDDQGNTLWTRTYGGEEADVAECVKKTDDGAYIMVGSTDSFGAGDLDFWLIKTDSIGDTLWTRTYGGILHDIAFSVEQTIDGGYVIAGYSSPFGTQVGYLVKTGPGIRIISPIGGEEWRILQTDTVRWVASGCRGGVQIELNRYYPDGDWEVAVDSTGNDGEEVIFVTAPPSDFCRMRINGLESNAFDISDSSFSIVSSQGYLALVNAENPIIAVERWDAGLVECPNTSSHIFYFKNFGNESLIAYPPDFSGGDHFMVQSQCDTFILAPGEVSACSLTVTYDPLEDGVHHDTLLIMSDAVNSVGGYVRIPLSGEQISTPQTPIVMITIESNDARLTWEPITESILGCPVDVTGYLIFYSSSYEGPYYFLNFTSDTTFVHTWVARFASSMFYEAIAYTGSVSRLDRIRSDMTKEEVMGELGITN